MNESLSVLKWVAVIMEAILLFNLVIIVHEYGHFLAARMRGLYVDRFSLFFGKPLLKWQRNGVSYQIGCIPFGGFVSVPQMASSPIEGAPVVGHENLKPATVMDKIVVAVAGPFASFLLALAFALVVWGVGRPAAESELTSVIGYVAPGSAAEKAGFQAGDKVLKVNGGKVNKFSGMVDSVEWQVARSEGDAVSFQVERDGKEVVLSVKPAITESGTWDRPGMRHVDIEPVMRPKVTELTAGGPADRAGMKPEDIILEVNGAPVLHPNSVSREVNASKGNPIDLLVSRNEQTVKLTITPASSSDADGTPRFVLGILGWTDGSIILDHPSPFSQLSGGARAVFQTIQGLSSQESDIRLAQMSGPVGVVHVYTRLFHHESGWMLAFWFSVVLNVNLALINMLPLPVLDGGHVVLAIVEGVRKKPIPLKTLQILQGAFAALIFGYVLYVTFFDVRDTFI